MKYGIVGSGSANSAVVHEGLRDIRANDPDAVFHIHARRSPHGSVGDVYDYLIDNEAPFVAHTRVDDSAPKVLLDSAVEVLKIDDPLSSVLKESDRILILWDEENNDSSEKIAITASDMGLPVLDLSMALTPVVIEGEKAPEPVVESTEDDVEPFTRAELESMTIAVLRRQAKSVGVENPKMTKAEIIAQIMGDEDTTEEGSQEKVVMWADKYGAIQIRIDEKGVVQDMNINVKALIDSGFLKPSTS